MPLLEQPCSPWSSGIQHINHSCQWHYLGPDMTQFGALHNTRRFPFAGNLDSLSTSYQIRNVVIAPLKLIPLRHQRARDLHCVHRESYPRRHFHFIDDVYTINPPYSPSKRWTIDVDWMRRFMSMGLYSYPRGPTHLQPTLYWLISTMDHAITIYLLRIIIPIRCMSIHFSVYENMIGTKKETSNHSYRYE